MSEILDALQSFVSMLIRNYGYPGIFLLMLSEILFPPFPSEIVMPFAGFLVAREELVFIGVILAGVLGSGLGAVIKYYFGYWLGRERVRYFSESFEPYEPGLIPIFYLIRYSVLAFPFNDRRLFIRSELAPHVRYFKSL
jgi:membrane protein YqaA with SNARE-associated domain